MNFKNSKALLQLIRIPNLIIIGITLCLLYANAEVRSIDVFSFFCLCLGTILVGAAGNIINDILDVEIDLINKKNRVVIGSIISVQTAWRLYFFLNISALVLSILIGVVDLFFFFSGAIFLLYFYSTSWKRQVLIGNLVVAFLCAWVIVQFWWLSYASLTIYWHGILMAYTAFAFLSTLVRELVKDIEDLEGDKLQGCQTLAIKKGISFVKKVVLALFSLLLLILITEACFFYYHEAYLALTYLVMALIFPVFYLITILGAAKETVDFSRISRLIKAYMLLGLILLLLV